MFSRLKNLIRGFLGLFISGLEKANPRALIEAEKENLRKQIARFNDNLATHAGFVERLMRQIKNLEKQETELAAKAAAHLKLGHRKAGRPVRAAAQERSRSSSRRTARSSRRPRRPTRSWSRPATSRCATRKAKIESLKRMLTETEMLEAQAELQEMAQGMITSIGGSGDTLARVEEYLTERRDKAAGRARVAAVVDRHRPRSS